MEMQGIPPRGSIVPDQASVGRQRLSGIAPDLSFLDILNGRRLPPGMDGNAGAEAWIPDAGRTASQGIRWMKSRIGEFKRNGLRV